MQDSKYVKGAFSRIADKYVITNHVLSLGIDIIWRKKVAQIVKEWNPSALLDIATGTGDLALEFQRVMPDCEVTGSDFCPEMLAHASSRGVKQTLVADALALPFSDNEFDVVTVAFGLRNMADWKKGLNEMFRVLKPDGRLLVLDFSLPNSILRKPYVFYLNEVLPKLAGILTGQKDAYQYLSGTIQNFPSGQKMEMLIESQGFSQVSTSELSFGVSSIYMAAKPSLSRAAFNQMNSL